VCRRSSKSQQSAASRRELHDLAHENLEHPWSSSSPVSVCAACSRAGLPQQATLVIREQPRGVQTEPELARNRLDERNVGGRPRARHVPVEPRARR
jgi:hypothetical protein